MGGALVGGEQSKLSAAAGRGQDVVDVVPSVFLSSRDPHCLQAGQRQLDATLWVEAGRSFNKPQLIAAVLQTVL